MRLIVRCFALSALWVAVPGWCASAMAAASPTRVVLVMVSPPVAPPGAAAVPSLLDQFAADPRLSIGLLGATQGAYSREQALLDISQGTRVSRSTYRPREIAPLQFVVGRGSGRVVGWADVTRRARRAPADIVPGLLGAGVPGGAAFVGVSAGDHLEALIAADRSGRVADVSFGTASSLAGRTRRALASKRFVVVVTPRRIRDLSSVRAILALASRSTLVIALQRPPGSHALQMLRVAMTGRRSPGTLRSPTTRRSGLVAGIDIAPTVLDHLGVTAPKSMRGEVISTTEGRDVDDLTSFSQRTRVVGPRRLATIAAWLSTWLLVVLVLGLVRDRPGTALARRLGGLALLWVPALSLLTAAVHPGKTMELAVLAIGSFGLAAVTEHTLAWPRGPVLPAIVTWIVFTIDLWHGSALTAQSILGPNPRSGARFFGIGNELEAGLTVVLLAGVGAATAGASVRVATWTFATVGAVAALVVGAGRLGADVGGVITIGVGAAAASVLASGTPVTRRRAATVAAVPVVAVATLAAVDLATGGNGHFTRSVLRAESPGDVVTTIGRRYELALHTLTSGITPLQTLIAVMGVAYAIRYRDRIYGPAVATSWRAAIGGGAAGVAAGALSNDSGPVLLIVGVFVLACVSGYLNACPTEPSRP